MGPATSLERINLSGLNYYRWVENITWIYDARFPFHPHREL